MGYFLGCIIYGNIFLFMAMLIGAPYYVHRCSH